MAAEAAAGSQRYAEERDTGLPSFRPVSQNLDGAGAKLKDANQKGPHWADPLKAWGDVLVKQGHMKEALVKYDEAIKYAPNWKQLKIAREGAAKQKS